jgi:hypothetical protein
MFQRWQWLTFLHWRYDPEIIRPLLPQDIELDTFDGAVWVGLTPFLLAGLRPPFGPALPWLSRFPETNVRTYVRGRDGERGVWFFTLDADRLVGVLGARSTYCLPYRWADMSVTRTDALVEYKSARRAGNGSSNLAIAPGEKINAGNFDNFLTARYRLYTICRGEIAFAQIEHPPWPLRGGRVIRLEQTLLQNSGVPPPAGEPVVHFSEKLDVRIGLLQRPRTR